MPLCLLHPHPQVPHTPVASPSAPGASAAASTSGKGGRRQHDRGSACASGDTCLAGSARPLSPSTRHVPVPVCGRERAMPWAAQHGCQAHGQTPRARAIGLPWQAPRCRTRVCVARVKRCVQTVRHTQARLCLQRGTPMPLPHVACCKSKLPVHVVGVPVRLPGPRLHASAAPRWRATRKHMLRDPCPCQTLSSVTFMPNNSFAFAVGVCAYAKKCEKRILGAILEPKALL